MYRTVFMAFVFVSVYKSPELITKIHEIILATAVTDNPTGQIVLIRVLSIVESIGIKVLYEQDPVMINIERAKIGEEPVVFILVKVV